MTQNNLGLALRGQADRLEGAEGGELLTEAMAALRSCLEIYIPDRTVSVDGSTRRGYAG